LKKLKANQNTNEKSKEVPNEINSKKRKFDQISNAKNTFRQDLRAKVKRLTHEEEDNKLSDH